jgi:hypothetical protein
MGMSDRSGFIGIVLSWSRRPGLIHGKRSHTSI